MKFDDIKNENYCATVVSLKAINALEGCDFVSGTPIFGFQAIVDIDSDVGDMGIVFPAECQLSEKYCRENNLYRHVELNKDKGKTGYIEDNRRVKAMKFRGHRSDCLFMPLESLAWTGIKVGDLVEGDSFDTLKGNEICIKYVVKGKGIGAAGVKKNKFKEPRVDEKVFPKHYDSDNYWRNKGIIKEDMQIIVTQKLHGTSVRIGHVPVKKKQGKVAKLFKRPAFKEFDYVFGSRRVIKDPGNESAGFYDHDVWSMEGERVRGLLPKGVIIYGEIIGFVESGGELQGGYTYDCGVGTSRLVVYRVAMVNEDGFIVDLVWDQVKEFCADLGLNCVVELWRGKHRDFIVEDWIDKRFKDEGYVDALALSGKDTVDEGVCVRVDGLAPYILKAKSPIFLGWESEQMDLEVEDIEESA